MNSTGLDYIRTLIHRGESVLRHIEESGRAPNKQKLLERRWNIDEISHLLQQSKDKIIQAQTLLLGQGCFEPFEETQGGRRTKWYTLKQLNQLRAHFKSLPHRDSSVDECLVLAVQTFKGGVGKSVTSVALSQYLASQGYRVLLIDMDSQASSTSSFGYIPDRDILDRMTLLPYFQGHADTLNYAILKTYWEGLDLIPSNLQVYQLELGMAEQIRALPGVERNYIFKELQQGIATVKQNYDVVIMDSPPALGFTSMNILCAADAILVPTPPALYEFSSTVQYLRMIENVLEIIAPEKTYAFIKILATDVFANQTNHKEFLPVMRSVFGMHMMTNQFFHSAEIGNAAISFQTALELRRPQKRALEIIHGFCQEIEMEILKTWPSKCSALVLEDVVS